MVLANHGVIFMGLKFNCPRCNGELVENDKGLDELSFCIHCKSEITIPSDPKHIEHISLNDETSSIQIENDTISNKRGLWVYTVYWFSIILCIVGIVINISNYFLRPYPLEPNEYNVSLIYGIFLLTALPFIVGVLNRKTWAVKGLIIVWIMINLLFLINLRWDMITIYIMVAFFYHLTIKSDWENLQ